MALCVLAALLSALTVSAGPPAKAKEKPPKRDDVPQRPLFQPFEIKSENMATLTIGTAFAPQNGPWCSFGALYAGSDSDVAVWNLRGPLSTRPGRIQLGAATLFMEGFGPKSTSPLVELASLQAGDELSCWNLINTEEVRPWPKFFLEAGRIRDRKGIFNGDPEIELYSQILAMAHFTSTKAFASAARQDVTYTHLFNEPEHYRGQVIHIAGRLIRVLRFDPQNEARGEGVSNLYEGWVMTDAYGENPVCIVFTDLPPGLKVDPNAKLNIEVGFDGYFYKRYRYKAGDSKKANQFRDAPLLIGHSPTGQFGANADEDSGSSDTSWGHNILYVFLSVVGGTLITVIGLTCWFRLHDRRVRNRISASRDTGFVPPAVDEPQRTERVPEPPAEFGSGPRWSEFPQAPD